MAYIEMDSISYTYPDGTEALTDVSLSVGKGQRIAVLGENGSGKSTLFFIMSGLLKANSGSYRIDGKSVSGTRDRKKLVGRVGLTFQNPDVQIFAPTVYQEVAFGPVNLGLDRNEIDRRTIQSLESTGMSHLKDRHVQYLSYGQKKRVAIADILAMETEVLILDEPFAWLDRKGQEEMDDILDALTGSGKTVIISTHDPDFAWRWAGEIILFRDGRVIGAGPSEEIFHNREILDEAGIDQPGVIKMASALGLQGPIPGTIDKLAEKIVEEEKVAI